MASYSCIFRTSIPWLAIIGFFFLAFAQSSGFGFLTVFLTSSAMILCPVVVCRSKSTSFIHESSVISSEQILQEKTSQNESQACETTQEDETTGKHDYVLSSSDALSDSESSSIHQTTFSCDEYSDENDWLSRKNISLRSTTCSDGSISDEESLIEIALPTGHYVESKSTKQDHQKSWKCCSLETHFRQQTWMEMLNEMNEENFIEIDLCMGSIKCSRFEIEA